jgi:ketosteroid isomerase-like protein
MKRQWGVVAMLGACGLAACVHRQIEGTSIEDTPDNKAIIQVLAAYKDAFERRDADAVLKLVSPKFYETNGTADPADDYDYLGLSQTLASEFRQIKQPALDMDVRKIDVQGDEAAVNIYFSSRYQMADAGPNGGFKASQDVAQIHLHREGGGWKITSGI